MMRFLFFFAIAICSGNGANAQLSEKVEYPKKDSITDEKGKTIGRMIVIPGLRTEVVLKSCIRTKDSTGHYNTEYAFIKPNHLEAHNITLVLQFDKSFDEVIFNTEGGVENLRTTVADNKLGASFQVSRLAADAVIKIKVISKKANFVTITGISGQITRND